MEFDRRNFLKLIAGGAMTTVTGSVHASENVLLTDGMGMLVDTTECIGCRKCEFACNHAHDTSHEPLESFEDRTVFDTFRRMNSNAYTVVNRFYDEKNPDKPTYVKSQCMHCLKPACVSACLVGALNINDRGGVTYEAWKCMGCRYCLVACPFEVPSYEYMNALTPEVRKCDFCAKRTEKGELPACAEICPPMCLTYGKREDLLKVAHEKIEANPDRYLDHVYGEHEAGGTAWMYLASKEFKDLGMIEMDGTPVPNLTETIQHSVLKYGIPPMMLYGMLGAIMYAIQSHKAHVAETEKDHKS